MTDEHPTQPALVVFGLDEQRRPRAGTFTAAQAEEAGRRAGEVRFVCKPVEPAFAKLAGSLQAGDLGKPGTGLVPVVVRTVYERVLAATGVTGVADSRPALPGQEKHRVAPSRDEIEVSDLVLVSDPEPGDGWYEAVVLERMGGDVFRLKYLDYPEHPEILRNRADFGLLPPRK